MGNRFSLYIVVFMLIGNGIFEIRNGIINLGGSSAYALKLAERARIYLLRKLRGDLVANDYEKQLIENRNGKAEGKLNMVFGIISIIISIYILRILMP